VSGRLSVLQKRILVELAGLEPPWTLVGGGAVAGIHFGHRTTRDLDLFWRPRATLGTLPDEAQARLSASGLDVRVLRREPTFVQLQVADDREAIAVDLVSEPARPIAEPAAFEIGSVTIAVATPHELLVSKLCALLSRSELRDLWDVEVLLEAGGDLTRAAREAPQVDAGFSPLTLAWVLESFEVRRLGALLGSSEDEIDRLEGFRRLLVERLTRLGDPAAP
jgi:hypothetical protein